MAVLTGLFQRGSSYYLRVVLPNNHPMKRQYKNGEFVTSLGRCSRREAATLGTIKRAEVLRHHTTAAINLPVEVTEAPPSGPILRDIYTRWKASKTRSADSLSNCLRAVTLYELFTGNPPITLLTREQGDGFRTWLQHPDRKTTSKTARDRLTWVKSVLNFAARDLGLISRNPWAGLDISFKTTNKRRPWTGAELQTFFTQPLHTAYLLPTDKKAGADAAYWIPLLGLYTGARVGELAQLRVIDVDETGEFPVLSITDEGEGQSVKSQAGVRKVPLHDELIRLGFLDYVAATRVREEDLLWPLLATRQGKPGGYFSQWFGTYRRSLGFGMYPDFHCLRHTVRSQMAEAEIAEQVMDSLVGHEVKGSIGAKVYTHRTLRTLKKAIDVLQYPALRLPRIYP
jgi:integrase